MRLDSSPSVTRELHPNESGGLQGHQGDVIYLKKEKKKKHTAFPRSGVTGVRQPQGSQSTNLGSILFYFNSPPYTTHSATLSLSLSLMRTNPYLWDYARYKSAPILFFTHRLFWAQTEFEGKENRKIGLAVKTMQHYIVH